jgi:uncharacterized protein (DUF2384 family)
MSEPSAPVAAAEERVPTKPFRKRFTSQRLEPERVERQGRVARLAFEALGREAATSFLNSHDDALGGRPLDLAIASAEGLAAVEASIAARKAEAC